MNSTPRQRGPDSKLSQLDAVLKYEQSPTKLKQVGVISRQCRVKTIDERILESENLLKLTINKWKNEFHKRCTNL